ncbi:MAG TPA: oxygenase MpaB family protein [Acidimicrobiales bacterium]|nr:oxygenase MpaB family protein [Acidimicrobiales bacterium]
MSDDLRSIAMSGLALLLAGANVIMQLSQLPVGRGVVESRVESGSLAKHPLKRTRTTLAYIVIALFGSEGERKVLRREVNGQHRQVLADERSPVDYHAFDPRLQLWVGACMYRGFEDATRFLYGEQNPALLDEMYRHCARFVTTLQVSPANWPEDRAAFERYWREQLTHLSTDEQTRSYLNGIASLAFLPAPIEMILGPFYRFVTTGFLDSRFRNELGLPWNARREWMFGKLTGLIAWVNGLLPNRIREFPWNIVLWGTRRRIRHGLAIV